MSFFRNARSLFCSSSSSWEKKDWGKFIFLSNMTTSLQFHLHFLMRSHNWLLAYFDGVSKSCRNICIVSLKKKIAFRVTKDFLSRQIWAMKNKSYNNSKRFYWIHELKWFYQYKNLWSCIAKHRNKSLWKEVCDLHTCDSI